MAEETKTKTEDHEAEVESPEVHFEPIIQLAPIKVVTLEEEEETLVHLRAKLFRFDQTTDPPEWKERGTGYVKLLKHKKSELVRVLMRRDKTLKVCANHYVQPEMELKPALGSERAWVWPTVADYSDEEPKAELLAIRFANVENAQLFKEKFLEAQEIMKVAIPIHNASIEKETKHVGAEDTKPKENGEKNKTEEEKEADSVAAKLDSLTVKDGEQKNSEVQNKTDDDKITQQDEKDGKE